MKKFNRLTTLVLALVLCVFIFASCGKKSDYEAVKEKGVLMIGVTIYDPMDYIDEDSGEWVGFDADLANLFGEYLGVDVRFTIINWDNKVMELNAGYIDMIWNGMTASDELGTKIDFSLAYSTNFQCAVVKADSSIATVADVKAATVAVESGSAGDDVATDTLGMNPTRVTAQLDALNEVLSSTSQVAIIDYTMALSLVGTGAYAGLKIVDTNNVKFADEVFAVGLRQGSDLTEKLNTFLKAKYADGTLASLRAKYDDKVAINESAFK